MKKDNGKSTGEKKVQFVIGFKKNIEDTELQDNMKLLEDTLKKADDSLEDIDNSLKSMF